MFRRLLTFLNKWILLEPSIFLFLMSARMVYFTRQNLFIDVVCTGMADQHTCQNMTQVGLLTKRREGGREEKSEWFICRSLKIKLLSRRRT